MDIHSYMRIVMVNTSQKVVKDFIKNPVIVDKNQVDVKLAVERAFWDKDLIAHYVR